MRIGKNKAASEFFQLRLLFNSYLLRQIQTHKSKPLAKSRGANTINIVCRNFDELGIGAHELGLDWSLVFLYYGHEVQHFVGK